MFGQHNDQTNTTELTNDATLDAASTTSADPASAPLPDLPMTTPVPPIDNLDIASTIVPQNSPTPTSDDSASDLTSIKKEALEELSPLVDKLDQPPEDKFRTTMMMIQASDNQSLIKTAYEIAKQITDEKSRAQALLDIVNEINYFTQHQDS